MRFKTLYLIACKSAWARRYSLILAVCSIAISLTLLLSVDIVRKQAKSSFLNTISQTDLIVGARSGPINLLLYSVFRIGNATNNISYESFERISSDSRVKWTIPLSLGDSHKGFRVVGTNQNYFNYFRYANKRGLSFDSGETFSDLYDTVIGKEVAKKLGYKIGDQIILSHGTISTDFNAHDDKPFRVTGILAATGTPVDQSVHVSLEALEAIHLDWRDGARSALKIDAEQARKFGLTPKTITAFLVGLERRTQTFVVQRSINNDRNEPLLAIVPGSTLTDLWRTLGHFETILLSVSVLVLLSGLVSMLIMLLSTLNERRREMAILRAIGAHAYHVTALFIIETLLIISIGTLAAISLLYSLLFILKPLLLDLYGFAIIIDWLDLEQVYIILFIFLGGVLFSLIPGLIAYRYSLQDGLTLRF